MREALSVAALAAVVAVGATVLVDHRDAGSPATAASSTTAASDRPEHVITVSGHGTVDGTPDTVVLQLGVEAHADHANDALAQARTQANKVMNVLKGAGVASKDIQTTGLNVSPDYDTKGRVKGYGVRNTVTASSHDIAHAGQLIDAAGNAAGDDFRLDSVTFSIEDTSKLVDAARTDATKRARHQAELLAEAAGVNVGSVVQITETATQAPMPQSFAYARAAADSATPIEPGTQQLAVDVEVQFLIG